LADLLELLDEMSDFRSLLNTFYRFVRSFQMIARYVVRFRFRSLRHRFGWNHFEGLPRLTDIWDMLSWVLLSWRYLHRRPKPAIATDLGRPSICRGYRPRFSDHRPRFSRYRTRFSPYRTPFSPYRTRFSPYRKRVSPYRTLDSP
jgi:hypothetical protein